MQVVSRMSSYPSLCTGCDPLQQLPLYSNSVVLLPDTTCPAGTDHDSLASPQTGQDSHAVCADIVAGPDQTQLTLST